MGANPQAFLQKLQQTGLLPMLMQKMGMKPPQGGAPSGGPQPPPQSITQSGGSGGQPGVGGAIPGGGSASASPGGGPQVKFDPSGGGSSMTPPIAQPHEAVQSIAQLLMGWQDRKKKGEEAEAANIAQNLIQAMRNGDKDTVNDILNNDHSKKILNKVYKGWLTKMQEAQKPGKEPDPTVSGFEAGIQKATSGQAQPPQGQPPGAGGIRMPQQSQAEQLAGAKGSAELQAAKQDPNRMLGSRLSSEEMRETELGAGPEKVQAEREAARAKVQKAMTDLQKAQLEVQKADSELKLKQTEIEGAKEKGKIASDIEHQRYLKSLVDLDIAKARLMHVVQRGQNVSQTNRLKMAAIDKAISIMDEVKKRKGGFSLSDLHDLANELKTAGATELVKRLPGEWRAWVGTAGSEKTVQDFADALTHYKESFDAAFGEAQQKAKDKAAASSDDSTDDDEPDTTGEPMEGDVVDGFRFNGGDP